MEFRTLDFKNKSKMYQMDLICAICLMFLNDRDK